MGGTPNVQPAARFEFGRFQSLAGHSGRVLNIVWTATSSYSRRLFASLCSHVDSLVDPPHGRGGEGSDERDRKSVV